MEKKISRFFVVYHSLKSFVWEFSKGWKNKREFWNKTFVNFLFLGIRTHFPKLFLVLNFTILYNIRNIIIKVNKNLRLDFSLLVLFYHCIMHTHRSEWNNSVSENHTAKCKMFHWNYHIFVQFKFVRERAECGYGKCVATSRSVTDIYGWSQWRFYSRFLASEREDNWQNV